MSLQSITVFLRRNFSAVLIVLGLVLLGFVAVEYGQMAWSQHQLQEQWNKQQAHRGSTPQSASESLADDGLTRLTIPKIDLAAVVVEGTGRKQLLLGPGHMESTPAPGHVGNSVITAHRDTFFRHIYELQKGDEIVVQRSGKTFKYEVLSKRVVKPTDYSVVDQSQDARLTLITCYPTYYIGPAPERLVVVSKLVNDEPTKEADAAIPAPPNVRKTALRPLTNSSAR